MENFIFGAVGTQFSMSFLPDLPLSEETRVGYWVLTRKIMMYFSHVYNQMLIVKVKQMEFSLKVGEVSEKT